MLRPLYFPYFAREGGVRNVEGVGGWVGVKVSIPARPERSRGRLGKRARVEAWVLRWRQCRGVAESKEQFLIPQP
ncbi:hypothetical protein CgunFtcFv8_027179 [Champsocephalus gunnari]|uniref:Uncharacterized protein n=1 Tax=Champsocephalus gunnari TaxID=52237 RepID=A0AAN8DX82_CHAGU|nr:hypothetical protein CgunFtcFv8_027179 [Champsocephalus gunnari]